MHIRDVIRDLPASRIGEVSAVAHEGIDGALVVKTLGREKAEVARLAEKAEHLRQERVAMGWLRATFEPGSSFRSLAVAPDNATLYALTSDGATIAAVDARTGRPLTTLTLSAPEVTAKV